MSDQPDVNDQPSQRISAYLSPADLHELKLRGLEHGMTVNAQIKALVRAYLSTMSQRDVQRIIAAAQQETQQQRRR